jgi:hypothetical protein
MGMGYPDLLEGAGGAIFMTQTNKTHARLHELSGAMLALLFAQDSVAVEAAGALALRFDARSQGAAFATPRLPNPAVYAGAGAGATLGLWLDAHAASAPDANATLIDVGALRLLVLAGRAVQLELRDAAPGAAVALQTDAECTARLLRAGQPHYLAAVLDAGAHVLTLSVDGAICDGGVEAEFGWQWLPQAMGDLAAGAAPSFTLGAGYRGRILGGHWYQRFLYASEVVGNWRAGAPQPTQTQTLLRA